MTKKEQLQQEKDISNIVAYLKSYGKPTDAKIKEAFNLYNAYYGRKEKDTGCGSCLLRIRNKLNKLSKTFKEKHNAKKKTPTNKSRK